MTKLNRDPSDLLRRRIIDALWHIPALSDLVSIAAFISRREMARIRYRDVYQGPAITDAERKCIEEDRKTMGREYYRLGAGGA